MTRKPAISTLWALLVALALPFLGFAAPVVAAPPPEVEAQEAETVPESEPATDAGTVASTQSHVSIVESPGEGAYYWPRWRGPTGQGIALGDDYPIRWSSHENVLWKVEVPGADSSSPIVWGDKLFLTTAETKGEERTRSILCYSTLDGELLWKADAPSPEQRQRSTQRRTDRAISTPATDGERVYAYLGSHGLLAVNFKGEEVWHHKSSEFDHATSSPLIHGPYVIILKIKSKRQGSGLYAYNRETGRYKWYSPRKETYASGSPIGIRVGDQEQIVVAAQDFVRSYDATSGEHIWNAWGTTRNALPTPVVGFGMVMVTSGPNGTTMAIHPNGKGNVSISHVAWKAEETGSMLPSPLFYDGYLYILDDKMGDMSCFDASTGDLVWKERIVDTRSGGLTASPVLMDGKIFVTDAGGDTHIFQAGPEFSFLGTNRLGEEVRASPALSEGRWYFRTKRHLFAIGHP